MAGDFLPAFLFKKFLQFILFLEIKVLYNIGVKE